MNPVFIELTPDLTGSIIAGPNSTVICSVFHRPTQRALYGNEDTMERAFSWLQSAKLIFANTEGSV